MGLQLLHRDRLYQIEWEETERRLLVTVLADTSEMTEREMRDAFLLSFELADDFKPLSIIQDSHKQTIVFPPEWQNWIAENVYPRWSRAGIKKLAIIYPTDFIAFLSIQQTVDEIKEKNKYWMAYQIAFFDRQDEALAWTKITHP